MKYISFFLLTILVSQLTYSQNLNLTNQKVFGGVSSEEYSQIIESPSNDGYFIIASSNSVISGNKTDSSRGGQDIWIIRIDLNFNILWEKTIGGSQDDFLSDAKLFDDKIYITSYSGSGISGEKTSINYGQTDIWLITLDLSGNILWQRNYGGSLGEINPRIISYKNNSLLICAQSDSPPSGNKTLNTNGFSDIWLVEISKSDGQIITQKNFGASNEENFPQIERDPVDGNIYISCTTIGAATGDKTDPGYGLNDIWVLKLDSNLNKIQDKCFGGIHTEFNSQLSFIDGHLYLFVHSRSDVSGNKTAPSQYPGNFMFGDGWLVKTDANLNILWDKTYGGTAYEYPSGILKNNNNNLVLSLSSQSIVSGNKTSPRFGMEPDFWLVITDPQGNILTQESYGGNEGENGSAQILSGSNQDLILLCSSQSGISGNKTVPSFGASDIWLAKINAGNFLGQEEMQNLEATISVYPNPFSTKVNFTFENLKEDVTLTVFSIDGKKVDDKLILKGCNEIQWEPQGSNNMYIYQIQGETILISGRIIKQ